MLLTSISNWDLPGTMWSTYTNATHKPTEGFTSSPGCPSSGFSHLPKSNKGMKDDYLIASGAWHDGLHCPVREGVPGGIP